MHPFTLFAVGITLITLLVYSAIKAVLSSDDKHSPKGLPGPRLIPWLGRVHDLPIQYMWLKFKEWADMYGPIYHIRMFGDNLVVVSDESIAEDLLVKRARIYSDRPVVRSLFDSKSTHGGMEYLPLMGKNVYWSRQRKLVHSYLTDAANARYHGVMEFEVKRWLYLLLKEPDNFGFSLENMASRVMCQLCWDDPNQSLECTPSAWGLLRQMSPAGPLTNVLWPLWHLPLYLNPWKMAETKRQAKQQAWWMERLLTTRQKIESGKQRPCWTRHYLETLSKRSLSGDFEAAATLGMLAIVGVFTVAGPLYYFLVTMVNHREWQAKCQQEIDMVCGSRMPTLEDMPKLPTIRACIKETMRWRPNVPTGVAHESEADDWYRGYFIPKGTRILPLDWAMLRNPVKYPDPWNFRPERWLEPGWPTYQEPLSKFPTIKGMTSFGWGQRQCLGQSLCQDELFVACSGLCWAFNLNKKVDLRTGLPIEVPTTKSNSLLIIKPDPFEMAFEPRRPSRELNVIKQWKVAEAQDAAERAEFLKQSALKQTSELG